MYMQQQHCVVFRIGVKQKCFHFASESAQRRSWVNLIARPEMVAQWEWHGRSTDVVRWHFGLFRLVG